MISSVLLILAGLFLLYVGAEALVKGSAALALRMGVGPVVIGLTVVAFGTSSPELVVSTGAALAGRGGLSIGNVVGSNICNIGLILGIAALIRPVSIHVRIIRRDVPVALAAALLLLLLLRDGVLSRVDGFLLLAFFAAYMAFLLAQARAEADRSALDEFSESLPSAPRRSWVDFALVAGGLCLLVLGARWLVAGAVDLAAMAGIGEAVIGLTVVAVGTSLPELSTSAVASFRGQSDISAGNVVGSNIFNILAILGVTALVRPVVSEGVGLSDLLVMAAFSAALLPLMRSGFVLSRLEGLALLAAYVIYDLSLYL